MRLLYSSYSLRLDSGDTSEALEVGAVVGQQMRHAVYVHSGGDARIVRGFAGDGVLNDEPFPFVIDRGRVRQKAQDGFELRESGLRLSRC